MINLTVREIAQTTGARIFSADEDMPVDGLSIDTRTIKTGEFFIALKGRNFNGHDYIPEAIKKGAGGIIAEYPAARGYGNEVDHLIIVDDTFRAMGKIAEYIRKRSGIPVICITGTNGKTTLKEILSGLLSSRYRPLKSPGTYNNLIGVSLTLFDLEPSHDIAVIELGSNHPGEIAALAGITSPDAAVITNIGDAHIEFFGDRKGVFREKAGLLEYLPGSGAAFLNGDDAHLSGITGKMDIKFFGRSSDCDFRITDIKKSGGGYDFCLNGERLFIPVEGEHNVYNAAAAACVAACFGIDYASIRKTMSEVSLPRMRLERISVNDIVFINDAYNANPDSFECALDVLKNIVTDGKKSVIAGDMLELGERAAELHKKIGKSIASKNIDFLITVGDLAKFVARGALSGGMNENRVFCAKDREDAARVIRELAGPSDVVLLKGSRSARMEGIIKCFTMSCSR